MKIWYILFTQWNFEIVTVTVWQLTFIVTEICTMNIMTIMMKIEWWQSQAIRRPHPWITWICKQRQTSWILICLSQNWVSHVTLQLWRWCAKTFLTTFFFKSPEAFQSVRKLSRVSRDFPKRQETFQRFWKLSRVSKNFQEVLETFHSVQKLSRVSRNFPECSETFQSPEFFQRIQKLSIVSGHFPECPENFLSWQNTETYAIRNNIYNTLPKYQMFLQILYCVNSFICQIQNK